MLHDLLHDFRSYVALAVFAAFLALALFTRIDYQKEQEAHEWAVHVAPLNEYLEEKYDGR